MIPFFKAIRRLFQETNTPEGKLLRAEAAEGRARVYDRRADRLNAGRRYRRLKRWAKAARDRAKRLREEAGS